MFGIYILLFAIKLQKVQGESLNWSPQGQVIPININRTMLGNKSLVPLGQSDHRNMKKWRIKTWWVINFYSQTRDWSTSNKFNSSAVALIVLFAKSGMTNRVHPLLLLHVDMV